MARASGAAEPRLAGEIRADIKHRDAAMARRLGLGGSETHVTRYFIPNLDQSFVS